MNTQVRLFRIDVEGDYMTRTNKRTAMSYALAGIGVGLGAGLIVSAASSGLAVYFARRLIVPETAPEDLEILHVEGFGDDMLIHLVADDDTLVPGEYGLYFDQGRGHAHIGDIVEYDPTSQTVSRHVIAVNSGNLRAARWGRWTGVVYPHPDTTGVPYEDVEYTSAAGRMPAWFLPTTSPNPSKTWAILIHGRAGSRAEGLRAAQVLNDAGIPALAIAYRNDAEVRTGARSRYGLGDTEWLDADAAIDWALAHGAENVVLMGWSMGGAIAFQTASRGRHANRIVGMVLDGPVVDWYNVLDHQAKENFLPTPVARLTLELITRPWARNVTGLETPLDLRRMDWVLRATELAVPVLLIHSADDEFVPNGPSQALARVRNDLVTMPHYDKARHTKEWNVDPQKWNDDVWSFLVGQLGIGQDPTA